MHDVPSSLPIVCTSVVLYLVWLSAASASSMPVKEPAMCPQVATLSDFSKPRLADGTMHTNLTTPLTGFPLWQSNAMATLPIQVTRQDSSKLAALQCENPLSSDKKTKKKKRRNTDKYIALKLLIVGMLVIVFTTLF